MRKLSIKWVLGLLAIALTGQIHAADDNGILYWMISEDNELEFEFAYINAALTTDLAGKTWSTQNGYGVDTIGIPNNGEGGVLYGSWDWGRHNNLYADDVGTISMPQTEFGPGSWQKYSFFIEVANLNYEVSELERVGASAPMTYDELVTSGHVMFGGIWVPSSSHPWMVIPMAASTPEPTSGLLLLLGSAALLLRRRKIA